jgi:prepilin-type N-terminal cleavage/methylation domain-containing protein
MGSYVVVNKGMPTAKKSLRRGFTLIELLLVIAIIAILATIVIVALNPVQRFADARNSRRWSDVNSLLTAVHEYIVDNNGSLPTGVTSTEKQLGTCVSGGGSQCSGAQAACLDLSVTLAKYLKSIPIDPGGGSASTTYYSVVADSNSIVTVEACNAENSATIQISR